MSYTPGIEQRGECVSAGFYHAPRNSLPEEPFTVLLRKDSAKTITRS